MKIDDKVCYCYNVSLRKLVNFARRERIQRASQLSNCLNAGTGCGWCIPVLKKIHQAVLDDMEPGESGPVKWLPQQAEEYADARQDYISSDRKNVF
jgi:NAD(P)H-nitrite reductase large subunit